MIIYQYKNGYRYNSDSLILYDFSKQYLKRGYGLDIGCGSGILALLLSQNNKIKMNAIDIQEQNTNLASFNFKNNNLNIQSFTSDINTFTNAQKYDFAICNPPFYTKEFAQNEHINISRHHSYMRLDDLLKHCSRLLKPMGEFCFCYDAKKLDYVFSKISLSSFKCLALKLVFSKTNKDAYLALFYLKKSSKSDLKILKPFVCYDENNQASSEFKRIYDEIKVNSCDL
ncbi:tRNA1(Val) (adenine(37)-N6)-methyltransferase [Campylobacter canadensis]|uniref:Methyltransferase n=1 Tax=Campylobacter canadensis TaxID=449520 RepID=A0ABS7WQ39_9BACT|nr:methyltransferase [Campylobacter canadensis]MBZ7986881.1 methyltransferase [Campylobacter canadensis]MBZ7997918.1 methyltransferase [Campylobacter canadensis]